MKKLKDMNITMLGLGMEGGSYAIALRDMVKPNKIWGIDINEDTLIAAERLGVIDKGYLNPEEPLKDTDILIISIFSSGIRDFIEKYQSFMKPGAVITDVAGVKSKLVPSILEILREDIDFVPGHPMAGNEHSGFLYANKNIFKGNNYIITPTEKNKKENIDLITEMAYEIGSAKVTLVDTVTHDKKIAYSSQLVHAISMAITNSSSYEKTMDSFIGGSFRDITRVAKINPDLWTDTFFANKEELLKEIDKFQENMNLIKKSLEEDDVKALYDLMEKSRIKKSM